MLVPWLAMKSVWSDTKSGTVMKKIFPFLEGDEEEESLTLLL
jgi:hypothetical protein